MAKLLLIEDDEEIAEPIVDFLSFDGHLVEDVRTGEEGLLRLKLSVFDLLILDWNLPGMTGLDVLTSFRQSSGKTPVIMLTAKSNINNRLAGLDSGADDYLTKPFDMRELGSRVRALLRRPAQVASPLISAGPIELDRSSRICTLDGQELHLLPKEFAIVEFLLMHKSQVFTADDLLKNVWRSDTESGPEAVRQCIARLRKKLHKPGVEPVLVTVVGSGYKIDDK